MADPPAAVEPSTIEPTPKNESFEDLKSKLTDLKAQAFLQYSIKNYNAASDLYAQASELQAEINGDMAPENAELLYLYGKSLYQVGVSKSDVLGGNVGGEANGTGSSKPKSERKSASAAPPQDGEQRVAEEVVAEVVERKNGVVKHSAESTAENKPYFQFTGDENFDDSDDSSDEENAGDGAGEDGEGEQEDDDLAAAWTVLDMARLLYSQQLDAQSESIESVEKETEKPNAHRRHLQERLADTHDLLAEISLEGEKFPAAVVDFKAALAAKKDLYPITSNLIAEAHYKLSLALEFASTTTTVTEGEDSTETQETQVDEAGRAEAASEMESAIASCEALKNELSTRLKSDPEHSIQSHERQKVEVEIEDLKEMIADMKQRATDLRAPPVTLSSSSTADALGDQNVLSGILGSMLGESPAAQKARVEEAAKGANDLTGLVRRRKADVDANATVKSTGSASVNGNGKRKAEVEDESGGKKAKVEDAADEDGDV